MRNRALLFYGIIFFVVVCAKIIYRQASNDTLLFILKPLSVIISFVSDTDFVYSNTIGFYFESLNITIDKSCSGINFWIISFAMFSVSVLKVLNSSLKKLLGLIIIGIGTYVFTLFANASRIIIAILISNHTADNYHWLHQTEGVFVYLSFLILAYTIFNHFISKFDHYHAKLT